MNKISVKRYRIIRDIKNYAENNNPLVSIKKLNRLPLELLNKIFEYLIITEVECNIYITNEEFELVKNYDVGHLRMFHCTLLTSINFSALSNLYFLDISYCFSLTSVNFSELSNLTFLNINGCYSLTSVNFSGLDKLQNLYMCDCTHLVSVNFSGLNKLLVLAMSNCCSLISIDLSPLISLYMVYMYNSSLVQVNFPNNPDLKVYR